MNVPGLSGQLSREEQQRNKMDEEIIARLAHALIAHCISDGDRASKEVSDHLKSIQTQMSKARYELEKITRVGSSVKTNKLVTDSVMESLKEINEAVVALQFFDRIAQRMEHSIDAIKVLHDPSTRVDVSNEAEIRRALVRIYNNLTMEDERDLFRKVESGEDINKALRSATKSLKEMLDNKNNIELF